MTTALIVNIKVNAIFINLFSVDYFLQQYVQTHVKRQSSNVLITLTVTYHIISLMKNVKMYYLGMAILEGLGAQTSAKQLQKYSINA